MRVGKIRFDEYYELMGPYCRFISIASEEDLHYGFGTVKYVNPEDGFVLLETKRGLLHL